VIDAGLLYPFTGWLLDAILAAHHKRGRVAPAY
jgi:hypothetical protein